MPRRWFRRITIHDLRAIFYGQVILQLLIVFILECLYLRLKSMARQTGDLNRIGNLTLANEYIRDWIIYLAPIEPDLSLGNCLTLCTMILAFHFLIYSRYIGKKALNKEVNSVVVFLTDKSVGHSKLHERLDFYLDELILSSKNYWLQSNSHQLFGSQVIDNDFSILCSMKLDKSSIWPDNRQDGGPWLGTINNFFLSNYISYAISVYIPVVYMIIDLYRRTKIYREMNDLDTTLSFFAKKLWIESILINSIYIDWCSMMNNLVMVTFMDNCKLMQANKRAAKRFLYLASIVRQGLHSKDPNVREDALALRHECNKLAIQNYVRLRYSIDASGMKSANKIVHAVMFTIGFLFVLTMCLQIDPKPIEKPLFLMNLYAMVLGLNSVVLLSATHYIYCSRAFHNMTSSFANCIFCNDENRERENYIVSSHTRMLWYKLIRSDYILSQRFATKAFGILKLDYAGAIKVNLLISYVIMVLFMYR